MIYALELRLSFELCCSLPTHPSKAPWYHISIRRATISLSLLFTLRHRSTLCESLHSSSTATPIGTFTLEQWHAHHTKEKHCLFGSAEVISFPSLLSRSLPVSFGTDQDEDSLSVLSDAPLLRLPLDYREHTYRQESSWTSSLRE